MKKLLYIPYIILLIIDWFLTVASNLLEVICKSVEELVLYLEKCLKADGKTKPVIEADADRTSSIEGGKSSPAQIVIPAASHDKRKAGSLS